LRTIGKWGGLVACFAIAVVWLASGWNPRGWHGLRRPGQVVRFEEGRIRIVAARGFEPITPEERASIAWNYGAPRPAPQAPKWRVDWEHTWIGELGGFWFVDLRIPLWAPFLLTAAPTALMWWRDRRPRPGHCRCGYSLAGLEGKPCPECGRGAS
jgi:hypothetical protein